jgi:hypothetical protein
MALSGKNVAITAAENQSRQTHEVEQKTSGLTLALSGTAGSALNSVVQATQDARSAGSSRLQALQGVKAALSGVQASSRASGCGAGQRSGQQQYRWRQPLLRQPVVEIDPAQRADHRPGQQPDGGTRPQHHRPRRRPERGRQPAEGR